MTGLVLDLCAGSGGFDLGARMLGLDPVGVEWDRDACATRAAAGLRTVRMDVTTMATAPLAGRLDGLLASPPCQTYSAAGKRSGENDKRLIYKILDDLARGVDSRHDAALVIEEMALRAAEWEVNWRAAADQHGWWEIQSMRAQDAWMLGATDDPLGDRQDVEVLSEEGERRRDKMFGPRPPEVDPRSLLVAEPLRFTLECRPRFAVWEQVPPVLAIWRHCAQHLRAAGYWVWTGVLNSADYGVPQTRRRAILLASLDGPVGYPAATHTGWPASGMTDLFGSAPLLPWVSMAEALGWNADTEVEYQRGQGFLERGGERRRHPATGPSPTIRAGSKGSGPNLIAHNLARPVRFAGARPESAAGKAPVPTGCGDQWTLRVGDHENATVRAADEPVPALFFGHQAGNVRWRLRNNTQGNAAARDLDEPAPTLFFGARLNDVSWVRERAAVARPDGAYVAAERADGAAPDAPCECLRTDPPGPTHSAGCSMWQPAVDPIWPYKRPATTIQGGPRVGRPGHKDREAGESQFEQDSVRITAEQAAILQSFPPDWPFQGTKTARFLQVGNAIPPLLAMHCIAAAAGIPLDAERAA